MKAIIKSLNPEACDYIDEVFTDKWRVERSEFYEDGVKMYDVAVNLSYVTIDTDEDADGVWLCRAVDNLVELDQTDFLAIVIR